MAVEREIKTVLTLEDASFRKGLKAASSSVSAARAEMQASVASAGGLGKGLKKFAAQTTGLNKVLKAEKSQMNVLKKEYEQQKKKLADATEELEKAKKEHGENAKEVQKAANAYAVASANVDDMRVKMANLNTQIAKDKNDLQALVTGPLKKFATIAATSIAAAGAALIKFTQESNTAEMTLKQNLTATETQFGVWSHFLEQEAESAWKNMGLSKSRYLAMANEIGGYLLENGAPLEDAAQASAEVLQLAAQLSQEYGVPIEEVWSDIKDAADGSETAMYKYGIRLTGVTTNTNSAAYQTDNAVTKLTNFKKIVEDNYKPLLNFANKENEIKNTQTFLAQSTGKLTAAWDNFLSGSGSASDVGQAAAELAIAWATNLSENATKMVGAIGPFFSAFADELWARVTASIPQWLKDLIDKLFPQDTSEADKYFDERRNELDASNPELDDRYIVINRIDDKRGHGGTMVPFDDADEKRLQETVDEFWDRGEKFLEESGQTSLSDALLEELAEDMDQSFEEIQDTTERGIGGSVQVIEEKSKESAAGMAEIAAAAADLTAALSQAAQNLYYMGTGGGGINMPMKKAGGAWDVPFDNYMAALHKGEMVLTADQARRYRAQAARGGNTYNESANIYIDKYNQYSGDDANALLLQMQALQRRQRMGYGLA